MLELTENARKELEAFFSGKEKEPIRIFTMNGCGGPRLALALDSPNADSDISAEQDGFDFCINKELLGQIQGVKIDMSPMGFDVVPTVPLPQPEGGAGGCGGCCGGCGH